LKKYSEFHDGSLDGLLIEDSTAHIFVSTLKKEHFVFECSGVSSINAGPFKAGNIIFDVLIRSGDELDVEAMVDVHGAMSEFDRSDRAELWLLEAHENNLILVSIGTSYGAECFVLASTIELRTRQEWIKLHMCTSVLDK
jgi:hypothetical protein